MLYFDRGHQHAKMDSGVQKKVQGKEGNRFRLINNVDNIIIMFYFNTHKSLRQNTNY